MTPAETLIYWIEERYDVYEKKEFGLSKPWSTDPIFQKTYFCNVHRENDKVTKWIRNYYSPRVGHDLFEYNIILSRFLNHPFTLGHVGYQWAHQPRQLLDDLTFLAKSGNKVWGNAYVITTHGIPMGKAEYLCQNVLETAYKAVDKLIDQHTCAGMATALQGIEGIGSFLAGQIVADIKNTKGHKLYTADDRHTFVVHGPGSLRGASWFHFGNATSLSVKEFGDAFKVIREYVDANWPYGVPRVDNQDLQNCLCEFDKYMRVKNGTGRSKRSYPGC